MRKIFVPLVIVIVCSVFMLPPRIASAHNMKPNSGTICYEDQCDDILPHATDGGSNCPENGLLKLSQTTFANLIDDRGQKEGELDIFASVLGTTHCNTDWATVFSTTTYMQDFSITLTRSHTTDDTIISNNINYTWPNYPNQSWNDGLMLGCDGGLNDGDIMQGSVVWHDRDGVQHSASTNQYGCP